MSNFNSKRKKRFKVNTIEATLKNLLKLVDSKTGIVRALIQTARFNDEPQIFGYIALLCNMFIEEGAFTDGKGLLTSIGQYGSEVGNGYSLIKELAMIKALGEAVERYCMSIYRNDSLLRSSYKDIEDEALNPMQVVSFSKSQVSNQRLENNIFDETTNFRWVKGYSVTQKKTLYVPAQLVFFPFVPEKEQLIRLPSTNGAAEGITLEDAICHGICECVERDACIINWLNKLPRELVEIEDSQNEHISKLREIIKKYKIEIYVYDITTDIPIPTMMAIAIDRSGVGPAVSIGSRSNLDYEEAIIVSIEEALKRRPMVRSWMENPFIKNSVNYVVSSHIDRYLYWSRKDVIPKINFLLEQTRRKSIELLDLEREAYHEDIVDGEKSLRRLVNIFEEKKIEVAYVDVTTSDIQEILSDKTKTVKVIIPELQTPYFPSEQFKYLGGKRLYEVPKVLGYRIDEPKVNELNNVPHQF